MSFYKGPVPSHLQTDSFLIKPLHTADNALDYAAMRDRWETKAWMAEGHVFTPQMNLEALRKHQAEHLAREAFTFTIMNPAETLCLGCLYISPVLRFLEKGNAPAEISGRAAADDAAIRFWLRDAYRSDRWNHSLMRSLLDWLGKEWSLSHPFWHTNPDDDMQRALLESYDFRLFCVLDLSYGAFYRQPVTATQ